MTGGGIEIYNSNFTGNSALKGGVVYATGSASTIDCDISNFYQNEANQGGAIFVDHTPFKIRGCSLSNNMPTLGGALLANGSSPFTAENVIVSSSTGQDGAGFWMGQSDVYIVGTTFSSNNASGNGGGIYQIGGALDVIATFTSNIAVNGSSVYTIQGEFEPTIQIFGEDTSNSFYCGSCGLCSASSCGFCFKNVSTSNCLDYRNTKNGNFSLCYREAPFCDSNQACTMEKEREPTCANDKKKKHEHPNIGLVIGLVLGVVVIISGIVCYLKYKTQRSRRDLYDPISENSSLVFSSYKPEQDTSMKQQQP